MKRPVERPLVPRRDLDGVLFSLSYSVMPEPRPALARAWERLHLSARVVVMDLGLTEGGPRRLLDPIARLLDKLAPGDPYSNPWDDLAAYGPVETKTLFVPSLLRQFRHQAVT